MKNKLLSSIAQERSTPPQVNCRRLNVNASWSWEQIERAFRDVEPVVLGQAWREMPEPAFAPGFVRMAYTEDRLLVFATLIDGDIHNPVEEFNALAFLHGDAFEMFFRPAGQASYVEFHVTPRNQLFQLRIPSAEVFQDRRRAHETQSTWRIADRRIESRVQVAAEDNMWWVLATIPFDMVVEADNVQGAKEWLFSYSRYDYTRGADHPVLSSSSPHALPNFHCQQEWGTLTF